MLLFRHDLGETFPDHKLHLSLSLSSSLFPYAHALTPMWPAPSRRRIREERGEARRTGIITGLRENKALAAVCSLQSVNYNQLHDTSANLFCPVPFIILYSLSNLTCLLNYYLPPYLDAFFQNIRSPHKFAFSRYQDKCFLILSSAKIHFRLTVLCHKPGNVYCKIQYVSCEWAERPMSQWDKQGEFIHIHQNYLS